MKKPLVLIGVLASLGCDPQAPADYRGEPIGFLKGTITSELSEAPASAEVILGWINWHSDPGTVVGTRVPVEGTFPAGFHMTMYLEPPDDALNFLPENQYAGTAEPRIGFAWILVMKPGAIPEKNVVAHSDIKGVEPGDVYGWAEDYVYAYVDGGVPEGSFAEQILSGQLEPGFHVMKAPGRGGADLEEIRRCKGEGRFSSTCRLHIDPLVPAEDGMDTEVPVRLTPNLSDLRVPVFALPDAVEQAFGIAGD